MSDDRDDGSNAPAASAVWLAGLWNKRDRFVVLDDCFDGGRRFQTLLQAWRSDPDRCAQLHVITASLDIAGGLSRTTGADEIASVWPPITSNLHRLAFEGGRVQWLLVPLPGTVALRELVAEIDAFACTASDTVDGHAARRHAKALARVAATDAQLYFSAGAGSIPVGDTMCHALRSAGFAPLDDRCTAEPSGSRLERWHYAPRFQPRHAPSRLGVGARSPRPALIVGAGLAGCAMAWALAEQGRASIVFERHLAPAMEASGNPGGLFHGIVNPQDGAHARFNRAAALEAQRAVAIALTQHGVQGSDQGLLRLEHGSDDAAWREMQATLARMGLPARYVQALSAREASAHAGLTLPGCAWWYPGGGWVQPGGLARSFLERAGDRSSMRAGCAVQSLTQDAGLWQLRDGCGAILAESDVVVLANAGDALRLLRPWTPTSQSDAWPLLQVRGQISTLPSAALGGRDLPRVPITGAGYLLPDVDGLAIFGATSQVGDDDPTVRHSDHQHNLDQLSRLAGIAPIIDSAALGGRTGWRWTTDDRLPVLGGVPDFACAARTQRMDQPAQVPRLHGLYACTALGSRGITWSALAAQVVAASIARAPIPIEASLLDSVDAARWVVRAATRPSRRIG